MPGETQSFARDGLNEALRDFGVDTDAQGLDTPRQAWFVIGLGDVRLNYQPAFRAKAITKLQIPAGGAGLYGGALIFAPPTGLWVTSLQISAGATAVWAIVNPGVAATYAAWALAVTWTAWTDTGENLVNSSLVTPGLLTRSSLYGTADATAPIQPGAIDAVGEMQSNIPLWVPGGDCLYIQNFAANASMNVNLAIHFVAQNPGRIP